MILSLHVYCITRTCYSIILVITIMYMYNVYTTPSIHRIAREHGFTCTFLSMLTMDTIGRTISKTYTVHLYTCSLGSGLAYIPEQLNLNYIHLVGPSLCILTVLHACIASFLITFNLSMSGSNSSSSSCGLNIMSGGSVG